SAAIENDRDRGQATLFQSSAEDGRAGLRWSSLQEFTVFSQPVPVQAHGSQVSVQRTDANLGHRRYSGLRLPASEKGTLDGVPSLPSVDFSPSECGSAGLGNDGYLFRAEASR